AAGQARSDLGGIGGAKRKIHPQAIPGGAPGRALARGDTRAMPRSAALLATAAGTHGGLRLGGIGVGRRLLGLRRARYRRLARLGAAAGCRFAEQRRLFQLSLISRDGACLAARLAGSRFLLRGRLQLTLLLTVQQSGCHLPVTLFLALGAALAFPDL